MKVYSSCVVSSGIFFSGGSQGMTMMKCTVDQHKEASSIDEGVRLRQWFVYATKKKCWNWVSIGSSVVRIVTWTLHWSIKSSGFLLHLMGASPEIAIMQPAGSTKLPNALRVFHCTPLCPCPPCTSTFGIQAASLFWTFCRRVPVATCENAHLICVVASVHVRTLLGLSLCVEVQLA